MIKKLEIVLSWYSTVVNENVQALFFHIHNMSIIYEQN